MCVESLVVLYTAFYYCCAAKYGREINSGDRVSFLVSPRKKIQKTDAIYHSEFVFRSTIDFDMDLSLAVVISSAVFLEIACQAKPGSPTLTRTLTLTPALSRVKSRPCYRQYIIVHIHIYICTHVRTYMGTRSVISIFRCIFYFSSC